mmetsp:Transcript_95299/g.272407  ORF Transcript_95299/g.272407 Transcript_95299/m.272407 type:complete len:266 (-) Transcript_95299:100-897(-)
MPASRHWSSDATGLTRPTRLRLLLRRRRPSSLPRSPRRSTSPRRWRFDPLSSSSLAVEPHPKSYPGYRVLPFVEWSAWPWPRVLPPRPSFSSSSSDRPYLRPCPPSFSSPYRSSPNRSPPYRSSPCFPSSNRPLRSPLDPAPMPSLAALSSVSPNAHPPRHVSCPASRWSRCELLVRSPRRWRLVGLGGTPPNGYMSCASSWSNPPSRSRSPLSACLPSPPSKSSMERSSDPYSDPNSDSSRRLSPPPDRPPSSTFATFFFLDWY